MNIDIRTLAFIIVITHLIQIIVFIYQYTINRNYRGIEWWLMWSVTEVLGFVFLLLREIPSVHVIAIILQNSLFIIGVMFLYIGVMRFFEKKENRNILFTVFLVFILSFLFFLFVNDNIDVRGIIICVTLAIISFLTAHSLLFHRPKSVAASANFNAVVFIAHGCFFLFRATMLIIGTDSNIFVSTLLNIATYLDALICSIIWTFVFVVMINQRLNYDMKVAKEEMELVFNTSPDSAVISRLNDGLIVYVNEGFSIISGYSQNESLGKSSLHINIWSYPADRQKFVGELLEKGSVNNFETRIQRKDNSQVSVLISAKIINIQDVPHIISVTRDITDLKRKEEALMNEKWRLANIIEGTNVGTWEWNVQTGETVFNEIWAQIIGHTLEELAPVSIKTWEKFTHPDDLKKSGELLKRHFSGELPYYECECRMKHKDGRWIEVLDRGKVLSWTDDGKPLMMFGTHTDITERRRKEEEMKELISKVQKAFDEIKTLRGIVPICANCKKIRDDKGYWEQVESYVTKHSEAIFSHSICPECMKTLYPEYNVYKDIEPDE